MSRPLHIWMLFGVCLVVLLAALGWVSVTTLRLDRAQMEAAQQAEIEENVRLALWRMDSTLNTILVEESARPFSAWESFSGREQVFTKSYTPIQQGEILTPSPLLSFTSSNVLLHFQLTPAGRLTSPQAPTGSERILALKRYTTAERLQTAVARVGQLQELLNQQYLQPAPASSLSFSSARSASATSALNRDVLVNQCAVFRTNTVDQIFAPAVANTPKVGPPAQSRLGQYAANAASRSSAEWQARSKVQQDAQNNLQLNNGSYQQATEAAAAVQMPALTNQAPASAGALPSNPGLTGEGLLRPLWIGSELLLARRVNFPDRFVVQGAWLSWTHLKLSLLDNVRDLFPTADLQPVAVSVPDPHARMLAAVPAQLITGPASLPPLPVWTASRSVLVVAWFGVLLAGLAVAVLLHGTVSLSERRAAFVSAVTHELRTPLTTFKMYSEMLAEGMVPEAEKRKSYLSTLCSEANRLSHLVENVLAYARLERGSARRRIERVSLGELLDRVKPRLEQRAAQADLRVVADSDERALGTVVHIDASAVEQILFNLVDNACKYAAPTATERIIHLEALPGGKFAMLRVRDHGQGISAEGAKRLFQPFSKSAHEAALTAPGVGLGLALCRRLSRSMGGDLRLDALVKSGACFVLTLPVSEAGGLTPHEATIA